jgi:predicted O-linked N-acetylglucosamine transferase (SPINDLY family)
MDVYQKALELHPNDKQSQETYLQTQYEKIMKNMKRYVVCKEINAQFNSMTYVFEHIKNALVEITNAFIPEEERDYLSKYDWDDLHWRKKLLDVLVSLNYRPLILWFFFYTNYFNHKNLDTQRKNFLENFELVSSFYPKTMYFQSINDLFSACPLTCLLFSVSYQNRNNKRILEKYAQTLRTICPDLQYQRIKKQLTPVGQGKRKVLFFSEFLAFDSSVLRDRLGIITQLVSRFDLYYASFHKIDEIQGNISKFLAKKLKDRYMALPTDLSEARNYIANQGFDIIIFCEIGMNVKGSLLAHSRMAPVQVTTWGHSETSGIPTIDYYISSQYF